ncbi:MAG: hypothetical protein JEZ08_25045 [Clostridiales bacterium]|nr:hypothetical protein [Clostridiales bacterium]
MKYKIGVLIVVIVTIIGMLYLVKDQTPKVVSEYVSSLSDDYEITSP